MSLFRSIHINAQRTSTQGQVTTCARNFVGVHLEVFVLRSVLEKKGSSSIRIMTTLQASGPAQRASNSNADQTITELPCPPNLILAPKFARKGRVSQDRPSCCTMWIRCRIRRFSRRGVTAFTKTEAELLTCKRNIDYFKRFHL
jgi:hypothetical protein